MTWCARLPQECRTLPVAFATGDTASVAGAAGDRKPKGGAEWIRRVSAPLPRLGGRMAVCPKCGGRNRVRADKEKHTCSRCGIVRFKPGHGQMAVWKTVNCPNCGGRRVTRDISGKHVDCSDCRTRGFFYISDKDRLAEYPGGPQMGTWPGKFKELTSDVVYRSRDGATYGHDRTGPSNQTPPA